ncbi:hypothetical protein HHK36_020502 [Tetracentron sinense]|uniref:Fe2OG dioxygenase domain-containing protein n=1 Tax=Tetracentron sinense TaxID=13715 RepID=A0A834YZ40_TETSI|nr:hypothetical protein HHK36_020502 [Tetracentron sinense]
MMDITGAREFPTVTTTPNYDRTEELKAFDETKAGVKGLVDAGVAKLPRIFIRPPDELAQEKLNSHIQTHFEVPVIDLAGIDRDDRRKEIVDEIGRASERWGFFQVVNHGVPATVLEDMIEGTLKFNEQDDEMKKELYSRDHMRRVKFISNFDLYKTTTANWRDTLTIAMLSPDLLGSQELPAVCREATMEYTKQVMQLGYTLFELLSEAIGLEPDHLKEMDCAKGCTLTCHYYPACPEPELALGTSKHSDPAFLTVLLQDQIGGLQVIHQDQWINVHPIPGALVVNIGDLLQVCFNRKPGNVMLILSSMQLISNDKLKSVEHRVLANRIGPRVSVACFFSSSFNISKKLYGPIKKLLSKDNPPIYREILMKEFVDYFNAKGLDGNSALAYFKLGS